MTPLPPLQSSDVCLVGRLVVRRRPDQEPELVLRAWCCHCVTYHTFAWADASARTNIMAEADAPCPQGPLAGRRIKLGLCRDAAETNWEVASRFRDARRLTRAVAV